MELIYLPHYEGIEPIEVKDADDAGIDLRAAIDETVTLQAGEDVIIPTGVCIHIGSHVAHNTQMADGWSMGVYGAIAPRSGLGFKHYLRLANTLGIIDAGYQGEIMVKVRNESESTPLTISRGDRICQLIFQTYLKGVAFKKVDVFTNDAERGAGGFGSTGVK